MENWVGDALIWRTKINVSNFLSNCVQAIGDNCNELQSLNLGWCEKVSDAGIMRLAYGCPDLRAVDLCGCVLITGIPRSCFVHNIKMCQKEMFLFLSHISLNSTPLT